MIKYINEGPAGDHCCYYFACKAHLDRAIAMGGTELNLLAMSFAAVHRESNTLLKLRINYEDVFDENVTRVVRNEDLPI